MLKDWLRKSVYFTQNEQIGVHCISLLIFILAILPFCWPYLLSPPVTDYEDFQKEVEAFFTQDGNSLSSNKVYFDFDPNLISLEEWQKLGVSEYIAKRIVNYRNKGGKFKKPEDLQKIYGFPEILYQQLLPFIKIKNTSSSKPPKKVSSNRGNTIPKTAQTKIEYFDFDPNLISLEEWQKLGVSEYIAKRIINYQNKGGRFRKPEDLQKIYGFPETLYQQLQPFISIPQTNTSGPKRVSYKKETPKIAINQANVEEWEELPGIGPSYAKRIVRFRDALGGFYAIEQIAETYKLPDSTFQKIRPYLVLTDAPKTININQTSEEELSKHPYLSKRQARAILKFIEKEGTLVDLEILRVLPELDYKNTFAKMQPYLNLGDTPLGR